MPEIEQGSPEWFLSRTGKFTGSKFADVLARKKQSKDDIASGKKPEKLKAYYDCVWQVVVERLTGITPDEIGAAALRWGKDVEPYAREAYELETGVLVEQTGFIIHPEYAFAGCSPDGLIGSDGALEIKCPKDPAIHLQRFISGIEKDHLPQVQGGLWVTGRKWWDFVSYDPRMPRKHRFFLVRVERDETFISNLESAVLEAEAAVVRILGELGYGG